MGGQIHRQDGDLISVRFPLGRKVSLKEKKLIPVAKQLKLIPVAKQLKLIPVAKQLNIYVVNDNLYT
jgi:hypothetical protein